jgi:hypothetical protein
MTVASMSLLPLLKPESAFEGVAKGMGGTRDDESPEKCNLPMGLREESREQINLISMSKK